MYKNKTEAADALFRELDNKVCDMYDIMEIEDFRECFNDNIISKNERILLT